MVKKRKIKDKRLRNTRPEWAIKKPRSSRICFRCQHKYSSHTPICGKIMSRKPEREECGCKTFVKNQYELDLAIKQEAGDERRRETGINAFMIENTI